MKSYQAANIRNVALLGHGSSGKTSLAEAMLFAAGATDRIGKTTDGNTVMDFDPEEKRRHVSVSGAVAFLEWKNTKINLIDAPGLFDFEGGMHEAVRAADSVLTVLSGKSGYAVGSEKAAKAAKRAGKPLMFFVSKLDSERSDFYKVFDSLKEVFGAGLCPVIVPVVEDGAVTAYVDLTSDKAFRYAGAKASEVPVPESARLSEMRDMLSEAVAGTDEALMEKYFEGERFTPDELTAGLAKGIAAGELIPVFCGCGLTGAAADLLLDALVRLAPSAAAAVKETAETPDGKTLELRADESAPAAAVVFKTTADPFIGKLSYFKVVSGKLSPDSALVDSDGNAVRLGKVSIPRGAKQEEVSALFAGDIGVASKLTVRTGSTLSDVARPVKLAGIDFPAPTLSMAVKAVGKGEEEKVAAGLIRLMEEDPTVRFETHPETKEQILSGLGEQHLDVIVSKLKTKFGVEVKLQLPRVPYRETIRKKVKVQGRHKKQSGGHGQYGDVWIEFEPCDSETLVFEEKIFGGAVPKNYFPAVEKGLQECIQRGVLAGYPVVGLKATLVDGSYHPVDSSEMSFKLAAALAYKTGLPQAAPVLLEPIGTLKVRVGDDVMGDVMGDINKRRGRVLGMQPAEDGMQEIQAEVPMAEMGDFSVFLRSATQGRGSFEFRFERYEEAPPHIAQKVIEEAQSLEAAAGS